MLVAGPPNSALRTTLGSEFGRRISGSLANDVQLYADLRSKNLDAGHVALTQSAQMTIATHHHSATECRMVLVSPMRAKNPADATQASKATGAMSDHPRYKVRSNSAGSAYVLKIILGLAPACRSSPTLIRANQIIDEIWLMNLHLVKYGGANYLDAENIIDFFGEKYGICK